MNFWQQLLNPRIPVGAWVNTGIDWLTHNVKWLFDAFHFVLQGFYNGLYLALSTPLYLIMIVVFGLIAFFAGGWRLALFAVIGFYFIRGFDQWNNAMSTIALVVVAVVVALVISIPLGILAARNRCVSGAIRPVLDLMQTLPAFVYLIPAIIFFGIGQTPGAVATLIFSLPPGVRLTELAIRQVDAEVVEAGEAFGSSPGRILRQIQIPLAMPTIMAGVNQVIMLALSMVVLAGLAGAGGLGGAVNESLQTLNIPLGVEGGLSVVIIAIFLDRVTAGLGDRNRSRPSAG